MPKPLNTSAYSEYTTKEIIECLKALEGVKKKLLNLVLKENEKGGNK